MIGETIKIGFDGNAVHKGLTGIRKGFKGLGVGIGRVTRQVGIGAARRIGASLMDIPVKLAAAIPNAVNEMSALSKIINAVTLRTGTSTENFLALSDAIAGVTGKDASEAVTLLGDMSERIGEAMMEFDSTPGKAMRKLGIRRWEMEGKKVEEQMELIADRYQVFEKLRGPEKAMFTITDLLGEIGKEMVPLFKTYSSSMAVSAQNTKGMARDLQELRGALKDFDEFQRLLGIKKNELALGFVRAIRDNFRAMGTSLSINDFIRNIDVGKYIKDIMENPTVKTALQGFWKALAEGKPLQALSAIWEPLEKKLVEILSRVIKNVINNVLPSWMGGGKADDAQSKQKAKQLMDAVTTPHRAAGFMFKKLFSDAGDGQGKTIAENTDRTNRLLERMSTGFTSVYA